MTNIDFVLDYTSNSPETIKGSHNKIKTDYDIEVTGNCNRVQATSRCIIKIKGGCNTVYGQGDVYIEGINNVASSSVNSKLVFFVKTSEQVYTKVITESEAGQPFALINEQIVPVIRYHKAPLLAQKIKSRVLPDGETIDFYTVEMGGKSLTYCTDPSDDFVSAKNEEAVLAKIQTRKKYQWAQEEELRKQILNKIKTTQQITYGEAMLLGLCERTTWQSAVREAEIKNINIADIGTKEFSLTEACEIIDRDISLVDSPEELQIILPRINTIKEAVI